MLSCSVIDREDTEIFDYNSAFVYFSLQFYQFMFTLTGVCVERQTTVCAGDMGWGEVQINLTWNEWGGRVYW